MSLVHTCSSRFGAAGFSLQQAGLAGGRPAVAAAWRCAGDGDRSVRSDLNWLTS